MTDNLSRSVRDICISSAGHFTSVYEAKRHLSLVRWGIVVKQRWVKGTHQTCLDYVWKRYSDTLMMHHHRHRSISPRWDSRTNIWPVFVANGRKILPLNSGNSDLAKWLNKTEQGVFLERNIHPSCSCRALLWNCFCFTHVCLIFLGPDPCEEQLNVDF